MQTLEMDSELNVLAYSSDLVCLIIRHKNHMRPPQLHKAILMRVHSRWAVMANVEVLILGVWAVGHGTGNLVGPVPHNLRVERRGERRRWEREGKAGSEVLLW